MLTLDKDQLNELMQQGRSDPFIVKQIKTVPVVEYKTTIVVQHILTGTCYGGEFVGQPSEAELVQVYLTQVPEYAPLTNVESVVD